MSGLEWVGAALAIAAGAVVALQWRRLLRLFSENGSALLALERLESAVRVPGGLARSDASLPLGTPAPRFALPDVDGHDRGLDDLLARGGSVLLLFADAGSSTSRLLLPEVGRWQAEYRDRITVVVIARGPREELRSLAAEHRVKDVLVDDGGVTREYSVRRAPAAVVINQEGTTASEIAWLPESIRLLLARALRDASSSARLR